MRGTPAHATVSIDDRIVGPLSLVAARGVALPPGKHAVSVEAPGYFPHDAIVVAEDKTIELEVRLEALPD
jgi:hypothetical protein